MKYEDIKALLASGFDIIEDSLKDYSIEEKLLIHENNGDLKLINRLIVESYDIWETLSQNDRLAIVCYGIRYQCISINNKFLERILLYFSAEDIALFISSIILSRGFDKDILVFFDYLLSAPKGIVALNQAFSTNKNYEFTNWFEIYRNIFIDQGNQYFTDREYRVYTIALNLYSSSGFSLMARNNVSYDSYELTSIFLNFLEAERYHEIIEYLQFYLIVNPESSSQKDINCLLNLGNYFNDNYRNCIHLDIRSVFGDLVYIFSSSINCDEKLLEFLLKEIYVVKGHDLAKKFCLHFNANNLYERELYIFNKISSDIVLSLKPSLLKSQFEALIRDLSITIYYSRDHRYTQFYCHDLIKLINQIIERHESGSLSLEYFVKYLSPFVTLSGNKSRPSSLIFSVLKQLSSHLDPSSFEALFLAIFTSCKPRLVKARQNTVTFNNSTIQSIIVYGSESSNKFFGEEVEDHTFKLDCPDDYLSLPSKVLASFILALKSEATLSAIKVDDDAVLEHHEMLIHQFNRASFGAFDVIGIKTNGSSINPSATELGASLWAYGRLGSKSIENNLPIHQHWPKDNYPNGGTSYVVSRAHMFNSFKLILIDHDFVRNHTAEDMLAGIVMQKFGEYFHYLYGLSDVRSPSCLPNLLGVVTGRWSDNQAKNSYVPLDHAWRAFFRNLDNKMTYFRIVELLSKNLDLGFCSADIILSSALVYIFYYGIEFDVFEDSVLAMYKSEVVEKLLPPRSFLLNGKNLSFLSSALRLICFATHESTSADKLIADFIVKFLKATSFGKL